VTREEELVIRAQGGDRAALGELLGTIRDLVYNLAIRMLGSPADAEDASQEILVRLVTHLGSFRGESAFRTWVYRVASNHLLTTRARLAETRFESFEAMEDYLRHGIAEDRAPLEDELLVKEAKLVCTSGMLLRLDRDHRLAFILGEILELSSEEGAAVLEIAPEAFRKRLSRARERIAEFMKGICGLFDEANPCRCAKQAACASANGHLSRDTVRLASHRALQDAKQEHVDEVEEIRQAAAIFRGHPRYASPDSLVDGLRHLLAPGRSGLLD
jgi:RNA polymerase sigma factor (sigma-70 family)